MTRKEVAAKFGVSVSTVYNWELAGIITPIRVNPKGRKVIYDDAEVENLFMKGYRKQEPAST